MTDRKTLEANLIRYQHSGDLAAQAETLFALGEIAKREEEYSLAQGFYGQAWAAYEQAGDKAGMNNALGKIGDLLNDQTERIEKLSLYVEALGFYKELGDLERQAVLYMKIAPLERDSEKIIWAYQQANLLCEVLQNGIHQSLALVLLSRQYQDASSVKQAYINQALSLLQQAGDQEKVGKIYRLLARDKSQSDYKEAQGFLQTAYGIFKRMGNTQELRETIDVMMLIADNHGDYDTYRQYYDENFSFIDAEDIDKKFRTWRDLTTISQKYGDFVTARYAYQQCIAVGAFSKKGDGREVLYYWLWGRMEYYKSGHHEMGLALCQWAVTLMQQYKHHSLEESQQKLDQMRLALASSQNPPNNLST